jgi:hypothetical protein
MTDSVKDLEKMLADEPKPEAKRQKWSGFVESAVVNFFDEHKIEKLTIEDGDGNKAKLMRTKDNGIRVEYSSTVML